MKMSNFDNSVIRWNISNETIIFCNDSFSKKCGAMPGELVGKHINKLETDNGFQMACFNNLDLIPGETQTGILVWKTDDGFEHAELTTVQALSEDGQHVSEIQLNGLEDQQEKKLSLALDALLGVFTDKSNNNAEKKLEMLNIGLSYLSMQSGVIGSVLGNSLEIICVSGELARKTQHGDKIPIQGTVYQDALGADQVVASDRISDCEKTSNTPHVCTNVSSFIGTQISTSNGPLGVISFVSSDMRQYRFTSQEEKFTRLVADWVGVMIGNEEQLEFVTLQNDHYQSLFRSVPTMMMLCDRHGLILSISDRLSSSIGIDPLTMPGKNCRQFFIQANSGVIEDALQKGNVDHISSTLLHADGRALDVELSSSVKNIGSMQGVRMIVLADISERNQAMKKVEEQNKQLEHVNHSLNQFALIASHDLQQPLDNIQQFGGFLHEDNYENMNDEGRYHLDVILNSAQRMKTLIQDLLKFSSAAKGNIKLDEIDLNELLKDVCLEFDQRIAEFNAKVTIADFPKIQGDRSLVRQLFTNLIGNSLKYRDEGRDPSIQISCTTNDKILDITVSDNGIGFDQMFASQVFKPFNRLKTEKEYDGNGIGLSICATVCDKHEWDISVDSQPGVGSVFTIVINHVE